MKPRGRTERQRGATLVEYALIFTFLVVGSLGAVNLIGDASDREVNHQADCVKTRPPPVECQIPDLTTTTTTSPPVPPPPPPPPPGPPAAGSASWVDPGSWPVVDAGSTWSVTMSVSLAGDPDEEDPPPPIEGARVVLRVTIPGFSRPITTSCTSAADGTCTFPELTNIPDSVTEFDYQIVSVSSDPQVPPSNYPDPGTYLRP